MTTLVANSSGRKSAKDKKANPNKPANSPTVTPNNVTEAINNHTEDFRNKGDKFQVCLRRTPFLPRFCSDLDYMFCFFSI